MDDPKIGEEEVKPTSKVTLALIAAVTLLGGYEVTDIVTAGAQADKIVAEYVNEKVVEYAEKTNSDKVFINIQGRKCILPAECVYRPNIIIDSTMILEMVVTDLVSKKVWFKGIARCNDSTGRLDASIRIQPCSDYILNADTIPNLKE